MAKKIKVKLKKGVGKHLRLTDPGNSFIIDTEDTIEVSEEMYNRIRKYVEIVKEKPKEEPKKTVRLTSELKKLSESKE